MRSLGGPGVVGGSGAVGLARFAPSSTPLEFEFRTGGARPKNRDLGWHEKSERVGDAVPVQLCASPIAIIAATVERWFWRFASSGGRDCAAGAAECLVAGGGGCCGYRDGGVLVLATALLWRRRHARRGVESVEGAVG